VNDFNMSCKPQINLARDEKKNKESTYVLQNVGAEITSIIFYMCAGLIGKFTCVSRIINA
jgi:hypothetical protein